MSKTYSLSVFKFEEATTIRKTGKYAAPVQPELPLSETQETFRKAA